MRDAEEKIPSKQLAALYLEFLNDFLTVQGFADHHGFTFWKAHEIIERGRKVHNRGKL